MVKSEHTITPTKSYWIKLSGDVVCMEFVDAELIIEMLAERAEKKKAKDALASTIAKLQQELNDEKKTTKQGHLNYCELERKYNEILKVLKLSPQSGERTIKGHIQEIIDTYANTKQD